jgi:hypothetical protein
MITIGDVQYYHIYRLLIGHVHDMPAGCITHYSITTRVILFATMTDITS